MLSDFNNLGIISDGKSIAQKPPKPSKIKHHGGIKVDLIVCKNCQVTFSLMADRATLHFRLKNA